MDYKLSVPSLKHITMVHIGSNFFSRILNTASFEEKVDLRQEFYSWSTVKSCMSGIMDNLLLPRTVLTNLWEVIMQLYLQISDWIQNVDAGWALRYHLPFPTEAITKFYFNVYGEVCAKKMRKVYIENTFLTSNSYDITLGFKLACMWCLEDCVSDIWQRMNARDRDRAIKMDEYDPFITYWINELVTFPRRPKCSDGMVVFTRYGGILDPTCSVVYNLMTLALGRFNRYAAEYFWYKLTHAEKVLKVQEYAMMAVNEKMSSLLIRLLQYLNKEQQVEFFCKYNKVLICFLPLPCHKFFHPTLDLMWHTISELDYMIMLQDITERMKICPCERFCCSFHEVWFRGSYELRKSIIKAPASYAFVRNLLQTVEHIDSDTYKAIDRDMKEIYSLP